MHSVYFYKTEFSSAMSKEHFFSERNFMRVFLLLFCLILLVLNGCSGTEIPTELKGLCSVTITVIDGDQPIEGVHVSLANKGSHGAWGCAATTDSKGVAVIQTTRSSHSGKGAPPGTYTVALSKMITLPPDLESTEEDQNLSPQAATAKQAKQEAFYEKNRVIPKILEDSNTSPIELTVAEKDATILTIDIAQYKK
jgi:hypothetical protein